MVSLAVVLCVLFPFCLSSAEALDSNTNSIHIITNRDIYNSFDKNFKETAEGPVQALKGGYEDVEEEEVYENRPIIGIYTLPSPPLSQNSDIDIDIGTGTGTDDVDEGVSVPYFPSSYVKFVEAGGARVVPVLHTSSREEVKTCHQLTRICTHYM